MSLGKLSGSLFDSIPPQLLALPTLGTPPVTHLTMLRNPFFPSSLLHRNSHLMRLPTFTSM